MPRISRIAHGLRIQEMTPKQTSILVSRVEFRGLSSALRAAGQLGQESLVRGLRLRGDEVVLDAGCGTGRLTADLLEALPRGRVVGVDLSQNMLGSARDHLSSQFGARVEPGRVRSSAPAF